MALAGVAAAVVVGYSMHLRWDKDSGSVAQHQVLDQLVAIVGVAVGLAVVETSVGRPAVVVAVVEGASAAAVAAAWVGDQATLIICPT